MTQSLMEVFDKLRKFYGPQNWWPAKTRFEVIVGAILTQNTSWANVEKAIKNLKKARVLSLGALVKMERKKLAQLIRPAGYYNVKSKRLKNFIDFLSFKYDADLKGLVRLETGRLRNELLDVNGIGPETCDSILLYAFGRAVFVVDAYTKRMFSRHGLFREDATYEKMQKTFMDNLPPDPSMFNEYHALIVRLAKEFCKRGPRCGNCPMKNVVFCEGG